MRFAVSVEASASLIRTIVNPNAGRVWNEILLSMAGCLVEEKKANEKEANQNHTSRPRPLRRWISDARATSQTTTKRTLPRGREASQGGGQWN
jgi:hypothetical protein